MPMYKPGDVCIGQKFTLTTLTHLNGVQCEVVREVKYYELPFKIDDGIAWYEVEWNNGDSNKWIAQPFLRLKRPREQLSSWDEMKGIMGVDITKERI